LRRSRVERSARNDGVARSGYQFLDMLIARIPVRIP
jgi:hypothetical protein